MNIIHRPLGDEHPYQQLPVERTPRYPAAGQPVTVRFALTESDCLPRVFWQRDAELICSVPAEPAGDTNASPGAYYSGPGMQAAAMPADQQVTAWKAELPAFRTGSRVEYWIEAGNHRSEPFLMGIGSISGCCEISLPEPSSGKVSFADGSSLLIRFPGQQLTLGKEGDRQILQIGSILTVRDITKITCPGNIPDRLVLHHHCTPEEQFFGFGERFDRLNRRGTVTDTRVYEQYLLQEERTYMPVPFCISTAGYGHYIDVSGNVVYDLAFSDPARWSADIEIPEETGEVSIYLWEGSPRDILSGFTELTGRPKAPPQWAFGPWMSGNEWNSQQRVLREVEASRIHDIPVSVIVIEAWSDETTFYIWNGSSYEPKEGSEHFQYEEFSFPEDGLWPDPKTMVEQLHDRGVKVLLWQIPVYKHQNEPHTQHDRDWNWMESQGFAVKTAEGDSYRVKPPWFQHSLVLDVTNTEALNWWFAKRRYLLEEVGIDGFKTDGGEHIWGYAPRYADGTGNAVMWNKYPKRYSEVYSREVNQRKPEGGIVFSRAGFTGSGQYPMHWCGDQPSTWEAFVSVYKAVLQAGLSGIPFIGWDIGGFSGPLPSPELYIRSAAAAVFSPLFQYHSEYNDHKTPLADRTPWNIAEHFSAPWVIDAFRNLAKLRSDLMPYIAELAREAEDTGIPPMRPMWIDYPHTHAYWDQYCFGDAMLVAPVFAPGIRERSVYLPTGRWYTPRERVMIDGGKSITVPVHRDTIPVFVKEDASALQKLLSRWLKGE